MTSLPAKWQQIRSGDAVGIVSLSGLAPTVASVNVADLCRSFLRRARVQELRTVHSFGAVASAGIRACAEERLDRLPVEFADSAQLKLRFEREAKTISRLNHSHICTVHDVSALSRLHREACCQTSSDR